MRCPQAGTESIQRQIGAFVATRNPTPQELGAAMDILTALGQSGAHLLAESPPSLKDRGLTDADIRRYYSNSLP